MFASQVKASLDVYSLHNTESHADAILCDHGLEEMIRKVLPQLQVEA